MSRRTKIIIAVVGLLVVGGVVAGLALASGGQAPQIDVAVASGGDLSVTVTASGKVESGARADVVPGTSGVIAELLVEDGATVSEGAVLARLDAEPLELQVSQATAGVAQAEAALASAQDQAPSSGDKSAAAAGADAAWSAYQTARMALDNVGAQAPSATAKSAASAATTAAWTAYSSAKAAYDALKASIEASLAPAPDSLAALTEAQIAKEQAYAGYLQAKSAEQQLSAYDPDLTEAQAQSAVDQAYAAWLSASSTENKLKTTNLNPQLEAARAAVEQARTALAAAQNNLDKAEIKAPMDGVILFNALGTPSSDGQTPKAAVGSAVSPAAAPFTVVDLKALRFMAEVDEVDVDRIKTGMTAQVTLDAFADPFTSKVESIRPAATLTATGGTVFPVYISLDAVDKNVLIGMKGDASIEVDSVKRAITIPVEAVFEEGDAKYVYKVTGETLSKVKVTVGTMTDTEAQITSGIVADDTVALSGPVELQDGMRVKVKQ